MRGKRPVARPEAFAPAARALALLGALAVPVAAEDAPADRQAALNATLRMTEPKGAPLTRPEAGRPFALEVALTDAATGQVPPGLTLEGWLRPVNETDLPCTEAAQAFRATRRIPTGGIDLNGVLLASFNRDGSFGVFDPRLDLATANMLAAGTMGDRAPRMIATDRVSQRIVTLGADDRLRIVSIDGKVALPETDGPLPVLAAIVPDGTGGIWLAGTGDSGRGLMRLGPGDAPSVQRALDDPIRGLTRASSEHLLIWTDSKALLMDAETGTNVATLATGLPGGPRAADAVSLTDRQGGTIAYAALLGRDAPTTGYLVWTDAPAMMQPVPLPAPASRVAIDPDSGRVLFWDPAGAVSIVDPISGALVGGLDLHGGIASVVFAGSAAFLAAPDNASVSVVDLASLAPGQAPALQNVKLGDAEPAEHREGGETLVTLAPSPQVLAIHRTSQTGFIVDARSSMGEAPPMSAMRLRGGQPVRVAMIDRSFRETQPGRFATGTTLPAPGAWELVVTTGIGGLSTCFRIDAAAPLGWVPPPTSGARLLPTLTLIAPASPVAGRSVALSLALTDARDRRVAPASDALSITALEYGWRQPARAVLMPDDTLRVTVTFPMPGLYLIEAEDAAAPVVLDVP